MAIECRLSSIMCSENSIKSGLVLNATPRRADNSRPSVPKSKAFHGYNAFAGSSLRLKRNLIRAESIDYSKEFRNRSSAEEVCKEMQKCYELINNIGRGVVYLGSSRTQPDHPHFLQAMELGRELAHLLECTSWSGVGPGLMDAAVKGALQAGKPVGGFKIAKEAGEWTSSNFHPYLSSGTYLTCRLVAFYPMHLRFFSARKHALVDAAMRNTLAEHTAFIVLPGGLGTLDEIFEILTLIQLERLGSNYPVPFILMNYDGFYSRLIEFLKTCAHWGTVSDEEIDSLWKICSNNSEALEYLADFYDIAESRRKFRGRLQKACV